MINEKLTVTKRRWQGLYYSELDVYVLIQLLCASKMVGWLLGFVAYQPL